MVRGYFAVVNIFYLYSFWPEGRFFIVVFTWRQVNLVIWPEAILTLKCAQKTANRTLIIGHSSEFNKFHPNCKTILVFLSSFMAE